MFKIGQLNPIWFAGAFLSLNIFLPANADTVDVRCDFYPKGEDKATDSTSCTFSQRQGYIGIQRENGTRYDFTPDSDRPNYYTDQNGETVIREINGINGDIGLIFRTPQESIFIYWDNNKSSNQSSNQSSSNPKTDTTVQNFNEIAIQITEGEFTYSGILKRIQGKQFMGTNGTVRVLLNPYDGHVIVFSEANGEEVYNYYISPVSGVGEDPDTMCDPSKEPC